MAPISLPGLRQFAAAILVTASLGTPAVSQRAVLSAPVHGYLYMTGIKGEVTAGGYRGWHAIDGYRMDAVAPGTSASRARRSSRPTMSPLAVCADLGMALPQLVVRCAAGLRVSHVIVRMLKPGSRFPFLELKLYDATILSVGAGEDDGSGG